MGLYCAFGYFLASEDMEKWKYCTYFAIFVFHLASGILLRSREPPTVSLALETDLGPSKPRVERKIGRAHV